jgi:hypothetical protein
MLVFGKVSDIFCLQAVVHGRGNGSNIRAARVVGAPKIAGWTAFEPAFCTPQKV